MALTLLASPYPPPAAVWVTVWVVPVKTAARVLRGPAQLPGVLQTLHPFFSDPVYEGDRGHGPQLSQGSSSGQGRGEG